MARNDRDSKTTCSDTQARGGFRKTMLPLSLLLILGLVGTACGTPEGEGDPGVVKITYMRQAEGNKVELALIKEFEAANPDIKVIQDNVPANDTYNKLVLTTKAGNPPDVFMSFWNVDAASNGLAADLSGYLDHNVFVKRFTPAARGYGEWRGKVYGIPWRSGASVFMMNGAVLKAAGLKEPVAGWTWDDLKKYAKAMTAVGGGVYGFGFSGGGADFATEWQFWPFLLQNGGQIVNKDNRAAFNGPEGVGALEFLLSLRDSKVVPPGLAGMDVNHLIDLFASDKLGMWQDGPWFISIIKSKYPDVDLRVVPMTKNIAPGNIAGGTALSMSPLTKNPKAAWRFIDFMTSDKALTRWDLATENVPPNYAAFGEAPFREGPLAVAVEAVQAEGVIVANQYPESTRLNGIMRKYLQAAYLDQMKPQEALDQAAKEWNAVLARYDG